MQPDLGFTRWAIPLGTWFGVRVRANVWYPLILLLLVSWLRSWELALVCFGLLFASTVIHEFFHIFAARMTGGDGEDVLLWPLGGLAFTRPAPTFASRFLTPAAGPFADLLICFATLPAVLGAGVLREALNPMQLPIAGIGPNWFRDVLILSFSLNWLLFLVNLIPAFPLDGGQMLTAILARGQGMRSAVRFSVRVGWLCGAIMGFTGLWFDETIIVFLGFFVLIMNMQEMFRLHITDAFGHDGYGSDEYGSGYGSFDDTSSEMELLEPRQSFWQRWKENRAAARFERETEERAAIARRVDELLDKVHRDGMGALTAEERRFLDQASNKYRSQHGEKNSP